MLNSVEHEKSFITSGPDQAAFGVKTVSSLLAAVLMSFLFKLFLDEVF